MLLPLDISAYDQLIILPDGPVNDVPFEALIYQDQYLMRSHVVSYASHLVFVNGANSAIAPQNRPEQTPFLAFSPTYAEKPIPQGLVLRGREILPMRLFYTMVLGLVVGAAVSWLTEYF